MAFLFDADEAGICSACIGELTNELLGSIVERVDLAASEEKARETSGIDEIDAAKGMSLVLLTNKVRVDKDVAHPGWKWEAAVRAVLGGERTSTGLDGEIDRRIEGGNTGNTLWTEQCANDESEVATGREATEGDAIGVVDVWLRQNVVDDVLGIVAGSGERMFGGFAVVGVDKDEVGSEMLE